MSKISYYVVIGKETRRINFISGFLYSNIDGKKGWFRVTDNLEITLVKYPSDRNRGSMECLAIGKTLKSCKPVMDMKRYYNEYKNGIT